jgi:CRISPR/Cas system CSM-associated protein Csm3 (group 7 of RAMP superfamily)
VDHAYRLDDDPVPGWVRDRVGIDRRTGAARERILFDLEIVPAGVSFGFRLEYRHLEDEDRDREPLGALLVALGEMQDVGLRIGGRGAVGLGRVCLRDALVHKIDLRQDGALDQWLEWREDGFPATPLPEFIEDFFEQNRVSLDSLIPGRRRHLLRLHLRITTEEPLLVAGTEYLEPAPTPPPWYAPPDPAEADSTPSLRPVRRGGAWRWEPFLPGSALRGSLRARSEAILRTITRRSDRWEAACDPFDTGGNCAGRVIEEEREPGVDRNRRKRLPEVVREAACPICRTYGHSRLASRIRFEDGAAADGKAVRPIALDHVAIDRISGATAGRLKFENAPLERGAVFRTTVELEDPEPGEVALLLLALRDLGDGDLTLGAWGARGYGRVRLAYEEIEWLAFTGAGLPDGLGDQEEKLATRVRFRLSDEQLRTWAEQGLGGLPDAARRDLDELLCSGEGEDQ